MSTMLTRLSKGFSFKDLPEITRYANKSLTEKASIFADCVKDIVKAYGNEKNMTYCIYKEDTRLWEEIKEPIYEGLIYDYFDKTAKNIKAMSGSLDVKEIRNLIQLFDRSCFIKEIVTRSKKTLYEKDFPKKLDCAPDFLPIRDGKKINLRTHEVTERTENDMFTLECDVSLTRSTKYADKFFKSVFPDDEIREYVRKSLGYMLTGNTTARCFFVFYGSGRNGKSQTAILLDKILSKYYHQCAKEVFVTKKSDGPSPHMFSLIGKRVAVYSESGTSENVELDFCNLKTISGQDKINARGLYRDPLEFYAQCKLVLLTNYTPPLTAEKALKDRLRYVYFDQRFTDNPEAGESKADDEFLSKLMNEYLDEVFTWIAHGARKYYEDQVIEMPPCFVKRTNKLLNQEDPIEAFITRHVKRSDKSSDYISRANLYQLYKQFCSGNGDKWDKKSALYNRLEHLKFTTSVLHGYDVYRNIICTYSAGNQEHNSDIEFVSETEPTADIKLLQEENEKLKKQLDIANLKNLILETDRMIQETRSKTIEMLSEMIQSCKDKKQKQMYVSYLNVMSPRSRQKESPQYDSDILADCIDA